MQVALRLTAVRLILLILLAANWTCSDMTYALSNLAKEHLRARITSAWSDFSRGDFDAFASKWSQANRGDFRASDEDWQKILRMWKSIHRDKPTFKILDMQIMKQHSRVKMQVSSLEKDGSRSSEIHYDYWVFENGDWFLDDAARTE